MFKCITVNSSIAGTKSFISNGYVEYKPMHSTDEVTSLNSYSFVSSNQTIALEDFVDKLAEHEKSYNPAFNKQSKVRYGVTLKFLLDRAYSNDDLVLISNKVIKYYKNLPYYSFFLKEGKGNYLLIYVCERFYYPNGKEVFQYAKHDRYRDKLTGRIAKFSEDQADNLTLVYKKGDITKSDIVYFSSKETMFQFATTDVFEVAMNKLKKMFISLLEGLLSAEVEEGYSFPTYPLKELESYSKKRSAREWNNCIRSLSNEMNGAIYALKVTDCWDKTAQRTIYSLYNRYVGIIKSKHFTYDRWSFDIGFSNVSSMYSKDSISCLANKFSRELEKVMGYLIPVAF